MTRPSKPKATARKAGSARPAKATARPTTVVGGAETDTKPARQTKAALLRDWLGAPGGVSLSALMAQTGWQAHTVRAALSGLRKAGLTVSRTRDGDETIYAVEPLLTGPWSRPEADDAGSPAPGDIRQEDSVEDTLGTNAGEVGGASADAAVPPAHNNGVVTP